MRREFPQKCKITMYGFPQPVIPNDVQWNHHRAPHHPQWRPHARHGPRALFRPRNHGFHNHRSPNPAMQGGSEEYWCETCDRGFPTEDLLNNHKLQHQKCNIDGCQFIAHPKVITKHIQMQHSTGLFKKICKLNNPEEIDKWREERRKRYPTKTNIDKKAAELKEKIDRGEKMGLARREWVNRRDDNNQNRDINSGQGMKRSYSNDNNNTNQPESKFRKPNRKHAPRRPKILPTPEDNRSLVPFAGIQCLAMDSDEDGEEDHNLSCNDMIEDVDIGTLDDAIKGTEKLTKKPVVCGALSSLMCEYGSSDEEIDDIDSNKDVKEDTGKNKHQLLQKERLPQSDKSIMGVDKNLPQELKKHTEISSKSEDVEKNLAQEISASEIGTKSNDASLKPGNELDLDKKTLDANEDESDSGPKEIKEPKNEHFINNSNNIIKNGPSMKQDNKPDLDEKNNVAVDENGDDSGPEEVKADKNGESIKIKAQENIDQSKTKIVKKKVEVFKRKPIYRKPKAKLPSTLIYRLLSKEMKQERNKVLQCIRYIRKNNYFDKST